MKKQFRIEHLGRSCKERLGIWTGDKTNVSTPAVWLATEGGAIPNLTPETLQYLASNLRFAGLLLPFKYHMKHVDVLEKFGKGFDAFMGLPPNQWNVLVVPEDPAVATRPGYHTNNNVSLWDSTGNRVAVDFGLYQRGIKAMRPDAFVSLCDGETPKGCPKKRITKASSKSLRFLDQHLEQGSEKINSNGEDNGLPTSQTIPFIFGAIEGGYDQETRRNSTKQVAERLVDGFFLDGFHLNGEDSSKLDFDDDMKEILNDCVLQYLPDDKPRLYLGMCSPNIILKLVSAGVDMFDSSYVRHATDQGKALVFPNTLLLNKEETIDGVQQNENLCTEKSDLDDNATSEFSDLCVAVEKAVNPMMDLNEAKYKNDFRPISNSCSCYTCRKHTRAYINHLLNTNELLAPVLLTLHNLHHYATFFETIRLSIENDKFDELIGRF